MKIAIICESVTGNTLKIAQAINDSLNDVIYFGKPKEVDADLYFVASWIDKGNTCPIIQTYLETLKNKNIALVLTAGFGSDENYHNNLVKRISAKIDSSNNVIDSFICLGKMPQGVKQRYLTQLKDKPEDPWLLTCLDNFEKALSHPDDNDVKNAKVFAQEIINKINA